MPFQIENSIASMTFSLRPIKFGYIHKLNYKIFEQRVLINNWQVTCSSTETIKKQNVCLTVNDYSFLACNFQWWSIERKK